jgi:C1A family cysteine protease
MISFFLFLSMNKKDCYCRVTDTETDLHRAATLRHWTPPPQPRATPPYSHTLSSRSSPTNHHYVTESDTEPHVIPTQKQSDADTEVNRARGEQMQIQR